MESPSLGPDVTRFVKAHRSCLVRCARPALKETDRAHRVPVRNPSEAVRRSLGARLRPRVRVPGGFVGQ